MKYLLPVSFALLVSGVAVAEDNELAFRALDVDRNGAIDAQEAAADSTLANNFKSADWNSDGILTFSEYLKVVAVPEQQTDEEEAE